MIAWLRTIHLLHGANTVYVFLRLHQAWRMCHLFAHANYDPNRPLSDTPGHTLRWSLLEEPYPTPHQSGKVVIVGHTEQAGGEILDLGHVKCIDTRCHGYGWLTALDLRTGHQWQASRWGALRDGETLDGLHRAKSALKT